MSAGNFFNTEARALNLRRVDLTTSATAITYTAKTGRAADSRVFDRVITVTTTATNSMTITVPDGVAYGQRLLVIFEVEASAETVDVTTTTGDDATQMTAAGGYWEGEWHGSTLGWATINSSAT